MYVLELTRGTFQRVLTALGLWGHPRAGSVGGGGVDKSSYVVSLVATWHILWRRKPLARPEAGGHLSGTEHGAKPSAAPGAAHGA